MEKWIMKMITFCSTLLCLGSVLFITYIVAGRSRRRKLLSLFSSCSSYVLGSEAESQAEGEASFSFLACQQMS